MTATSPLSGALAAPVAAATPRRRWLQVVSHTDPRYGGLSSAVPAMAASLAGRGGLELEIAGFCQPHEHFRPALLRSDQISFWPTSRAAWAFDSELRRNFASKVRGADALHVHGLWEQSTVSACKTARKLGKPYVLSTHGMLEPWALGAKRVKKGIYAALIERANVAGAACLHALTFAEAEQYRTFGASCPIAVIPNAVTLPEDAHPELFLEAYPRLRGKRLVLFLSRLHPKKGLDILVESWAKVCRNHPEAHLVIAGPDEDGMQAALVRKLTDRGAAGQVTFTGMLAGSIKWSALEAAECYVLPSYSEGLSMALLEAMGMGVAVIATRACNMPEITGAGAGWEIEPNAAALTAALAATLARPAEENWAKGRNGARLIASKYTPAQVTRQMAEVYDYVLGGPQPASVQVASGGEQ